MMRTISVALSVFFFGISAFGYDIQVFIPAGSQCPSCSSFGVEPIIIGEQKLIAKKMSSRLASSTHPDAKIVAKEYMPQLKEAYQNIEKAYQAGVTKVPAIVINDQYIVYGSSNIFQAINLYRESQSGGQ